MKLDKTTVNKANALSWISLAILALLPFHAFLTVWLSSLVGHYTLLRLWKEILLAIVFLGVVYILVVQSGLRKQLFSNWLVRLIGIYGILLLITGFVALGFNDVTAKALAYGELVDLRFLLFFLMVLVVAACSPLLAKNWRAAVILPATLVITFGLLQYLLLPYDFLRHFGYGASTIFPYETINHNLNHLRIASTLRGANPLGAYLVLIISVSLSLLLKAKPKRLSEFVWLAGALLTLFFSFSRSAWLGTALSVAIIFWLSLKSEKLRRWLLMAAAGLVIVACAAGVALRDNTTFQDDILHTDNKSTAIQSSNQGHSAAFKDGMNDIAHQPQGDGVGTAGPASAYNNHPGRLAENYYLQIGQEVGIIGMGLFIAINVIVATKLWRQRSGALGLALFASLIGLSFVNLLSHGWTDDTIAYIWWGLAGISLSPVILKTNKHKTNEKIQQKSPTRNPVH